MGTSSPKLDLQEINEHNQQAPKQLGGVRGLFFLYIVFLVGSWMILETLVLNADQKAMHLLLVGNEGTYTSGGAQYNSPGVALAKIR